MLPISFNQLESILNCVELGCDNVPGLPQHQNGMYGLNHQVHHFMSFDDVMSLPRILNQSDSHWYGMIGKKHVGPSNVYPFPFSYTELDGYDLNLVGRYITFMNEKMQVFLKLAQEKKKPFLFYMTFFDVHRCGDNLGVSANSMEMEEKVTEPFQTGNPKPMTLAR